MYDRFNRKINYLRISVTDRCNLKCRYCIPAEGFKLLPHSDILTYEEIADVVKSSVLLGVEKVRITGGEPLIRKDILLLIERISAIKGINDLSLTTNGQLLEDFAKSLAKAGIMRVNVSLDTVDPDKYSEITAGGDIKKVIRGIVAAQKAGINPVKLNCVVEKSSDEPDALGLKAFARQTGLEVRFIHRMNLKNGSFSVVEGGTGGDCSICNRLRLTANGKVKPCLFNDIEFDVRKLGAEKAILSALENKPQCGTANHLNSFHNIGG